MEIGRKRQWDELGVVTDQEQPPTSRRRPPTFLSVIRGAMMAETIRRVCLDLEPMMRRVVRQEVQRIVCGPNPLYGDRQYYLEQPVPVSQSQTHCKELPKHKLIFAKQVPKSIYTSSKITDTDRNQLQIQLIDINTGQICTNVEVSPVNVKIVVIDGDLVPEGLDSDKFSGKIVKPRDGKRPLLVGNTEVTLNGGVGIVGDVSFTDNSKWIRSGKFRLGACVDSERCGTVIKIQEGLTEKFTVKDHRGELYEKHYPPMLNDEVWRLEIVAKDGTYHQRLKEKGINIVQDFLKVLNTNPNELKEILKMPTNSWNKVAKHARTCPMGFNTANLENNANLPTWPQETQTGAYGNGAESEAAANPSILGFGFSSSSPFSTGLVSDFDFGTIFDEPM